MKTVFWLAVALLAFTYLGYPLLMAARARLRPQPLRRSTHTPRVDVLLVVHNAADGLAAKLDNLAALDYPRDRLRVHVVCDGCTDATESIARAHPAAPTRVLAFAQRRGKSACIGAALPGLDGEVVVFTDVRQAIDRGAVRALVAVFADGRVGAASGELMLDPGGGHGEGVGAYWRYEKMIRRSESACGSLVGVTGALYAIRREALPAVPPGLILDDMWIPLAIADAGFRVVFVEEAIAHDRVVGDAAYEEARKRRTLSGNYQLLHRWPRLAVPGAHPLAWRLWGHKWLRLVAPWLLLAVLVASAVLAVGSPFFLVVLCAQVGLYAIAALGRWHPTPATGSWPARLATTFLSLNLSAVLALSDYLRNRHGYLWQTTTCKEAGP